jgi:uncharacterized membrane protein
MRRLLFTALLGFGLMQFASAAGVRVWTAEASLPAAYRVTQLPTASGADFFEAKRINNRGEMVGTLDSSTGPYKDQPHAGFYSQGRVIDLHLLVPGNLQIPGSLPTDLNGQGEVLFYTLAGLNVTWVYSHGHVKSLNHLAQRSHLDPSINLEANAINNNGDIVGATIVDNVYRNGFILHDGRVQLLQPLPQHPHSEAMSINNWGQVVGRSFDDLNDNVDFRAVLFQGRSTRDLGIPFSFALQINDHRHILGFSQSGGAFLWTGELPAFNIPFDAKGMNNFDQVVGTAGPWPPHAFIYSQGVTTDLNELVDPASGWLLMQANDINELGQIVGFGRVNEGFAGFRLDPIR